jgi:hypothetical protein
LARNLASPCLGRNPKARVAIPPIHIMDENTIFMDEKLKIKIKIKGWQV